jgi:hypothetical protein
MCLICVYGYMWFWIDVPDNHKHNHSFMWMIRWLSFYERQCCIAVKFYKITLLPRSLPTSENNHCHANRYWFSKLFWLTFIDVWRAVVQWTVTFTKRVYISFINRVLYCVQICPAFFRNSDACAVRVLIPMQISFCSINNTETYLMPVSINYWQRHQINQ